MVYHVVYLEIRMRRPIPYPESSVELGGGLGLSRQPKLVYYNMVSTAERVEIDRKIPYPCLVPVWARAVLHWKGYDCREEI